MNDYEKSRVLSIVDKWVDEHPNAVNGEERLAAVIRMELNRLDELHAAGVEEIAAITLTCGSDNRPRNAEFTLIKDRGSAAVVMDIEIREKGQPTALACIRAGDLARLRQWLDAALIATPPMATDVPPPPPPAPPPMRYIKERVRVLKPGELPTSNGD